MRAPRNPWLPVVLIAGGVLVLMNNLDVLTWDHYGVLADLWPLVLVLVGIRLVAHALLPPPAARVAGLVAVILVAAAAIGYVAASPPRAVDSSSGWAGVIKGA